MSMTIAELMDLLRSYPPGLRVVVDGYEEGYDDLSPERILVTRIDLDTGTKSWQGQHGDPRDKRRSGPNTTRTVEALALRRASW